MVEQRAASVPPLHMLYVYVTDQCNCRCRHCWIMPADEAPAGARNYLECGVFEHALSEAKPLGLQTVKWTGGEPTIHPELPRLLQVQRDHAVRGIMETNGMEVTAKLAATMRECGVDLVSVSLDGPSPELHDFVRGVPGAFERTLQGIRNLTEVGYRPQLIMSLMRQNASSLDLLLDLAEALGAGSVKLNIIQPSSRGREVHEQGGTLSVAEILAIQRRVRDQHRDLTIYADVPMAFRPIGELLRRDWAVCGLMTSLGLLASGEYALCGVGTMEDDLVFGRAGRDDLATVWAAHPMLSRIREDIPEHLEGVCGRCIMAPVCLGSCVAQNYMSSGRLTGSHWFCAAAQTDGLFPATRLHYGALLGSASRLDKPP